MWNSAIMSFKYLEPRLKKMASGLRVFWLLIAVAGLLFGLGCGTRPVEISLSQSSTQELAGQIYIGGAVNNPGFYPVMEGDSLQDLIQAAGGVTENADLSQLQLRIPQQGETEEPQKIDLNRAPAWLLEALPGIGQTKAQAIISYREKNRLFKNINELLKVEGIGQATFDEIKQLVTVAD